MEEVATIATVQELRKFFGPCVAKLISIPDVRWDTSGFSGERLAAHEKKMASKAKRAEAQLTYANLSPPRVFHTK